MGLMRKFLNQTRKPEGFLGKLMLKTMNAGHAKMADWGLSHLPKMEVSGGGSWLRSRAQRR